MLAIAPPHSQTSFPAGLVLLESTRPCKVLFGEAPKPAREARALPGAEQIWIVTRLRDQNTAGMNFTKNIGMLLLAIYLIIFGLIALFSVAIPPVVTGVLALAAGIFILIGR